MAGTRIIQDGCMRLRSFNPLCAQYMFIDVKDEYLCEASFEKNGLSMCVYREEMVNDKYPGLVIIFCKVWRWEAARFEEAMVDLDKRLRFIRPEYEGMIKNMNKALKGETTQL